MRFGRFEIECFNFGTFRLDGGAMFGSVPKNIWSSRIPADSENCIALATRCLLVRDGKRSLLVDVGNGTKWPEKLRTIFAFKTRGFEEVGLPRGEITDVVLTHLHFDHAGGITRFAEGSTEKTELNFPNATLHLQEANWSNAQNPSLKERASYLRENVEPLKQAKLNLVRGSVEIVPDFFVHQANGHTRGQQWIELRAEGRSLIYPTDLIPTAHHLPLPFHMGYDVCAETVMREREELLQRATERKAIVVFEHDIDTAAVTVAKDAKGHYCVGEVVSDLK